MAACGLKSPHSSAGPLTARRDERAPGRRVLSSRSRCRNAPHVPWYEQTASPSNVWMAQSTPGTPEGRHSGPPDERAGRHGALGAPVVRRAIQDVPLRYRHAPSLLDECRMICAVGCRAVMSINVRMVAMPSQAAMPFTSTWRSAVLAASS